jgi:MFS family permease
VAFMSAMACTRFLSDWFTHRFSARRVLQVSGLLTGGGLLLSVVQPNLLAAITGFFLVGAGVSSVVPLAYSAAGNSKRMASSAAISAVSSVGFVGFLLGPPVIGFIAQLTSLRISFAAVAILGFSITWIAGRARAFAPA